MGFNNMGMTKLTAKAVMPKGRKRSAVDKAEKPKPCDVYQLECVANVDVMTYLEAEESRDNYSPATLHRSKQRRCSPAYECGHPRPILVEWGAMLP